MTTQPMPQLVIDPVCKMELPADEAAATFRFNHRTYYFCHAACLHLFQADPLAYVAGEQSEDEAPAGESGGARRGDAPARNGAA